MDRLDSFIEQWEDGSMKKAFLELKELLEKKEDVDISFKARPGISYSLRAMRKGQEEEFFVMIDIIDDPSNRWLSICFYKDMISDPEERGNLIPDGLQGRDGYCFDLDSWDTSFFNYIKERIEEAYKNAKR